MWAFKNQDDHSVTSSTKVALGLGAGDQLGAA
ncbi:hypothetical protein PI125_g9821 [Phytophthora idaei]|nr:hypothetical protein PI125_g9821 [Phytophthora idaei]